MQPLETGSIQPINSKMKEMFWPKSKKIFIRYGVNGEGTCFWHSVCAAINYKGYLKKTASQQRKLGQQFRCDFANNIDVEDWNQFMNKRNISSRVRRIAKTKKQLDKQFCTFDKWADESHIRWTGKELGLNIIFIDEMKNKIYCGVNGKRSDPMVVILWIRHSHFEPMGVLHKFNQNTKTADIQLMFDPRHDSSVVTPLLTSYVGQCQTFKNDY